MQLTFTTPLLTQIRRWSLHTIVGAVLIWSVANSVPRLERLLDGVVGKDWVILTNAGHHITAGINPYDFDGYRYSPLVAYFFAWIEPIGWTAYTIIGLTFVLVLRDWRWIGLLLVLMPFWADVQSGITLYPVLVLSVCALRGERWATLAQVALTALVPRPLVVPVLVWLLWHDRRLILPSLGIAAAIAVPTVATGWADEWITTLVTLSEPGPYPIASTLGLAWLAVLALGIWLTVRGHLGLAALAVSPYLAPGHLMMLALEIRHIYPRVFGDRRRIPGGASRGGSDDQWKPPGPAEIDAGTPAMPTTRH